MGNKKIQDMVKQMVLPMLERRQLELVDVEYVKERNDWYLRVYIYKAGGVTIDDCQITSENLSEELDKLDPIKHGYILEVSSPGVDRPLKTDRDFDRYKGETVEVKLYKQIGGIKNFEGQLLGLMDGCVAIKLEDNEIIKFKKNEIALAKRIIKF